jgi:hypothetical protein
MKSCRPIPLAAALVSIPLALPALAGRPLTVDDTNLNDKGHGHIEAWAARDAGKADVLNLAPAFSPWEAVELVALLARDRTASVTSTTVFGRFRITPPQASGCNVLAALGHQHDSPGGNQPFAYSALTCNSSALALHVNLGAAKPSGASSFGTWGIALEHNAGRLTPHIEAFGQEHAKPTFQVGARTEVAKGWQVDGTLGRNNGDMLFSLGFKAQF